MKFTRDPAGRTTIQRVEPGRLTIGNDVITDHVAITSDAVLPGWTATDVDQLLESDFDELVSHEPELIILGTGIKAVMPPRELIYAFARKGIGLEAMDTRAACRTFNILVSEGRRPAAVLMLDRPG